MTQFKILTSGNPKTEKGRGAGYWTFILHLAPARLSGHNVCPMATAGCKAACLNTAGRGGLIAGRGRLTEKDVKAGIHNTIQAARIRKTRAFFFDRPAFMASLVAEIRKAIRLAHREKLTPVFRLNGTSDIRWEAIPVEGAHNVMELFPDIQFYDYTKIPNRRNIPPNYALTFSLGDGNEPAARTSLKAGLNVSAVFRDKNTVQRYLDRGTYLNRKIVSGDDTDLRFLDPAKTIVALYAKGNAKQDKSGFVRD